MPCSRRMLAEGELVDVVDVAGPQRLAGIDHLVARSRESPRAAARRPRHRRRPSAATAPMRLGVRTSPAASTVCPARMSAPWRVRFCPVYTGLKIRTRPSASFSVSSTITTASAPAGMGAPVAISVHCEVADGPGRHLRGEDRFQPRQRARRLRRRADGVGRAHGVSVHRRAGEGRHVRLARQSATRRRARWPRRAARARCVRSDGWPGR